MIAAGSKWQPGYGGNRVMAAAGLWWQLQVEQMIVVKSWQMVLLYIQQTGKGFTPISPACWSGGHRYGLRVYSTSDGTMLLTNEQFEWINLDLTIYLPDEGHNDKIPRLVCPACNVLQQSRY